MSDWITLIAGTGAPGVLIAVGAQLLSLNPPEFRFARIAFLCSAFLVFVATLEWVRTDVMPWLIATGITVSVVVLSAYGYWTLNDREAAFKARAFCKHVLGALRRQGYDEVTKDDEESFRAWASLVDDFLVDAYGEAERWLFHSGAGITQFTSSSKVRNPLAIRLQRLDELIARADVVALRDGFDPALWKTKVPAI